MTLSVYHAVTGYYVRLGVDVQCPAYLSAHTGISAQPRNLTVRRNLAFGYTFYNLVYLFEKPVLALFFHITIIPF